MEISGLFIEYNKQIMALYVISSNNEQDTYSKNTKFKY